MVVERLNKLIGSDQLLANSRLPPERDLVRRWRISRSTLRRALSVLEADGRIWRHVGRGTFAGPRPKIGPKSLVTLTTRLTNPAEIIEARLVLEPELACLATLRANSMDIARIERCLKKASENPSTYEQWDFELHRTIAESAHNSLLLALFDVIHASGTTKVWGRQTEVSLKEERRRLYCRQHGAIVDSIRDRDAEGAQYHMQAHLEAVQRDMSSFNLSQSR